MRRRRFAIASLALLSTVNAKSLDVLSSSPSVYSSPSIDTENIGDILLAGSFDHITPLFYSGQGQVLQPPQSSTDDLISHYVDDNKDIFFQQSFANGLVSSSCAMGDNFTYVLVGNFTSLLNVSTPNGIAAVNFSSGSVTQIPGNNSQAKSTNTDINGTNVNTVWCNGTSAYFGGSFQISGSYGASVWHQQNNTLSVPAFGGFTSDANINAIVGLNDSIIYGGEFKGLSSGYNSSAGSLNRTFLQPGMQPVSFNLANATGYGSENSNSTNASSILCPGSENSGWTADLDSTTGHIDVDLAYNALPTKIRLFNLADGSGTKTFRIISYPAGSFMNLTYTDVDTGVKQSCSAFCPLPENNSTIRYTDFEFVNIVQTTTLRIELLDFYGTHPGLNGIQLFEQGQHAFAYNELNNPRSCGSISDDSGVFSSKVTSSSDLVGSGWSVKGDYMGTNITDRALLPKTYAQLNPTFGYYAIDRGVYDILLYTPGCASAGTCGQRGMVNVTVYPGFGDPVSSIIYQTNDELKYDRIYNGTLQTGAYIRLTPTSDNNLPMELVAYEAILNYLGTNIGYNATNLFQYLPSNFTDSSITLPVGNTSINLFGYEIGSEAKVEALSANSSDNTLLIGGSNFPSNLSSDSTNLVSLDTTPSGKSVSSNSLNTSSVSGISSDVKVKEIRLLNDTTFAFTSSGLYVLNGSSLVSTGINSTVTGISSFSLNNTNYWAFSDDQSNSISLWDPKTQKLAPSDIQSRVSGHLAGSFDVDNATLYIGSLEIVGKSTPGGVVTLSGDDDMLDSTNTSEPFSFTTGETKTKKRSLSSSLLGLRTRDTSSGNSDPQVNGGCYLNSSDYLVVGSFDAKLSNNETAHNALIIRGNSSFPFLTSSESDFADSSSSTIFNVAAELNGIVAVGGQFSGKLNSVSVQNLIIYNSNSSSFEEHQPPALSSSDSSSAVNTLVFKPNSSDIIVGGQFSGNSDTNGTCNGVCSYSLDSHQYATLKSLDLKSSSNISALVFESATSMLIAGNLSSSSSSGSNVQVAKYDFSNASYSALPSLPGQVVDIVVLSNSSKRQSYVAAGESSEGNPFVKYYDSTNNTWTDIPNLILGTGSQISSLSTVTLNSDNKQKSSGSWPFSNDRALLVSGSLVVNSTNGVSMVAYNGNNWVPMYAASSSPSSSGSSSKSSSGSIKTVFSQFGGDLKGGVLSSSSSSSSGSSGSSGPSGGGGGRPSHKKHPMPVGHVVGIACGIGIGCVIVLSALYMLIELLFNLGQRDPAYQLLAQPRQSGDGDVKRDIKRN